MIKAGADIGAGDDEDGSAQTGQYARSVAPDSISTREPPPSLILSAKWTGALREQPAQIAARDRAIGIGEQYEEVVRQCPQRREFRAVLLEQFGDHPGDFSIKGRVLDPLVGWQR